MTYDFKFPRPRLTEFCFRFHEFERPLGEGPPMELLSAKGEMRVWIFINERWFGPYSTGLLTNRGIYVQSLTDEGDPDGRVLRNAIYECKHRLMHIQAATKSPHDSLTGDMLMAEYRKLYLPQNSAPFSYGCNLLQPRRQ